MSLVITKAALALKNTENQVHVVKYQSHKPKQKVVPQSNNDTNEELQTSSQKELDLKSIRHEIVRFGMSGFEGKKKEDAKIALAVSLGAKPPRGDYINYKELMQKKKEEKLKSKEEKELMIAKSFLQLTKKKKKNNPGHDVGHPLDSYGKVKKKTLKKMKEIEKQKKRKK